MWNYEKRLQYPVNITQTNPKIAQVIISQFGGPDGELSASMRYLSQRYTIPYREVAGLLTDIGREAPEMFHLRSPRFFSLCVRGSFQWMLSREQPTLRTVYAFCNYAEKAGQPTPPRRSQKVIPLS